MLVFLNYTSTYSVYALFLTMCKIIVSIMDRMQSKYLGIHDDGLTTWINLLLPFESNCCLCSLLIAKLALWLWLAVLVLMKELVVTMDLFLLYRLNKLTGTQCTHAEAAASDRKVNQKTWNVWQLSDNCCMFSVNLLIINIAVFWYVFCHERHSG